jgi:hypothetical protein
MHRSTLPNINSKLPVTRPRQRLSNILSLQTLHRFAFKIGRKHKSHRRQEAEDRPWRNTEKGRGKAKGKRDKMGNGDSKMVEADAPAQTLKGRSVEALAQYIKDGRAKRIVVMVSPPSPSLCYIANQS